MRIIGLTGSIACGKSTVSRWLTAGGWPVIDGDRLSRECTAPGGPALPAIRQAFGDGVFTPDGQLDRRALGSIVFADPAMLDRLNQLMAPFLRALTDQRLAEARQSGASLCFLEMPLLFEQGYDALCDTVWCVWLPESLQLARLMERDGITEAEARSRMKAVLSSDEKAARSRVVLDNSGTPEELLSRLPDLLAEEQRLAAPRRRRSARYETVEATPASGFAADVASPAPVSPSAADPASSAPVSGFAADPASSVSGTVSRAAPASPASPLPADSPRPAAPSPSKADQLPVSPRPAEEIQRPDTLRKKPSARRAAWALPSWLLTLLITCAFLLLAAFTAQCLMSAYLTRQQERHLAEQQAIDARYPLLYRELIERYATEYNLRPAYVSAIILNESSFDATAVSRVGARGLMQLMPDTAEWIAHKLKISGYAFERMYDPESNIRFGCWYLNYLSSLFSGDPVAVTCAYHAGQGEIASWVSNPQYSTDGRTLTLDRLPEGPTKIYAGRVTRDDGIYQAKYFSPDAAPAADGGGAP